MPVNNKRPILIAAVLLALGAAVATGVVVKGRLDKNASADAAAAKKTEDVKIPVEVALVVRETVRASFQGTASLEAEAEAMVVAKTSGVILGLSAEEGDQVRAGQVLARLENDRQRLSLAQSRANLRKLENDFKRQTELFQRKLIGSELYERSKFDLETQKAAYDLIALELSHTEIRAPISGTLTQRMVKVGNQVQVGATLFRIDDFDPLEAKIAVPEREMRNIIAGQPVAMLVDAMPGQPFSGKVARVSPVVDPKTGTFQVTAQFRDQTNSLRSGMFGRFNIVTAVHENVLVVPRTSLLGEDGASAVFVVSNGAVKRAVVKLGYIADGRAEVLEGVKEGEQVITLGQNAVREGSKVTVIKQAPHSQESAAPVVAVAAAGN